MKSLEFIYQETEIHFALQNEGNVMVNANEMAKAFNKRIDHFLKAEHTKEFIKALEKDVASLPPYGGSENDKLQPNGGCSNIKIIETNTNHGTFMHEVLALKFAAWLDVEFELWVYKKINEVLFGNYKKHWDAHIAQETAKEKMEALKAKLLVAPTPEMMLEYFEAEKDMQNAKAIKNTAIRNQYKLF